MFYKHSNEGKVVILIVYVDDIVLTGDDCNELEKLKGKLAEEFEIKDLGALKYFLGMEFARSKEGIFVNQRTYKSQECEGPGSLSRLVGRLIYLSHTHPDIAFSVSMVSQFMHVPRPEHFEVVYRILRLGWKHSGSKVHLWVLFIYYVDKKITGRVKDDSSSPMKLYCDNKAAISVAHNPVLHDRTKHVEVDKHFIKEKIDNRFCMTYIPTEEQVANVFTKELHKRQFDFLVGKLAMEDIFKPA
ncbi:Copia protein [Vitis vinifera]|uniref:Copia protein n=1 Tax=Vitis vinifera TaxID=29760 RepID=A0A438BWK8_VITVI|nr:Copia protein [Vitis vinifera]